MTEQELSALVGDSLQRHRKNTDGKAIPRQEIGDQLGWGESYLRQIERGGKVSMYNWLRILSCLPPGEARGALSDVLQAFGLASLLESRSDAERDREKLERIKAIVEE